MSEQKHQIYGFDKFRLDVPTRRLMCDGQTVHLPAKAFDLLLALVENNGQLLEKDELFNRVWPDQIVEESNLTVHISAIRKALGEQKDNPNHIVTVSGHGYRFVGDVMNLDDDDDDIVMETHSLSRIVVEEDRVSTVIESASIGSSPTGEGIIAAAPAKTGKATADESALITEIQKAHLTSNAEYIAGEIKQHKRGFLVTLSVLILVMSGLGYWFFFHRSSSTTPIESIAVMPFVNESGNSDVEYLSDGMTESLINSLSQLPNLSIKARSTVFRYKGKDVQPQQVGSELNVQAILNGRFVQHDDQLTLYLSLINVQTGNQIWGDQYNRKMTDLVALQAEIARDVSQKLRVQLSGADKQNLAKNYTANVEAYQFYLKGRYFWNKFTPAGHQKAIEYFNQAIARDPGYTLAYVGLANTYGASATNCWIPSREGYLKAKAAVKKALEIDDTLAQSHATLGALIMFSDFDWETAEREYKRAIELDPNYELTYELYSYLLSALGHPDEAIAKVQRSLELDILSATLSDDLAMAYYLARQYDQAIKQNQKTLEIEPDRPSTDIGLGNAYELKGMYKEAIIEYQKAISRSERTSNVLGLLGHAYAASGKRNEAVKILNEMQEMSKQKYVSPYDLAILYTGLGEKDKALEQLNTAYEERSGWIIHLKVEPLFDPLRSDPRFQDLLRRVGL